MKRKFPQDFIIGSASSSYQVEGAAFEGGRELSIWDEFSAVPGAVYAGENGNVAADQYHRFREDIALMKKLGLQSYRFSIAWGRIIRKDGSVNEEGIGYYRQLCTELHRQGLSAAATLYHWDLPLYIEESGGWTNRSTVFFYTEYAKVCFSRLGDLVDSWITFNEPWCIAYMGYIYGEHAPGHRNDFKALPRVIHHINLAHGLAVSEFRKTGLDSPIGITWNILSCQAAPYEENGKELEELQFDIDSAVFCSPVFEGRYPDVFTRLGFEFPIEDGDMELISLPIDFYGLNFYHEDLIGRTESFPFYSAVPMAAAATDMNWPVTPDGLTRLLEKMNALSGGLDVYVTENGAAYDDVPVEDKRIHDWKRVEFIRSHLNACLDAIEKGVPLCGYYVWTFIDNFEWAWGYSKRFGIVYLDLKTLERIPKDSAYYLMKVCSERCID